jgi:hypothetical protein
MSKIPYTFDTPVPSDFRKNGWFKSDNCLKFVTWAFARCLSFEHTVCHDNQNIKLKPFQFIFGRYKCSLETNMSEDEVRTQQKSMESAGFLKKCPNKTPNRFTIYEWTTEAFTQINPQVNPQVTPNSPPTHPHKEDNKPIDPKPSPPQTPQKKEVEGEDKKKLKILIKDSKDKNLPFSDSGILAAFKESSGLAVQKALLSYTKRNPKLAPLLIPDRWLRSAAIKEHEAIELQKDYET